MWLSIRPWKEFTKVDKLFIWFSIKKFIFSFSYKSFLCYGSCYGYLIYGKGYKIGDCDFFKKEFSLCNILILLFI